MESCIEGEVILCLDGCSLVEIVLQITPAIPRHDEASAHERRAVGLLVCAFVSALHSVR